MTVVLAGVLAAGLPARADDAELKRLRERVEALEAKLDAARRDVEALRKELADVRAVALGNAKALKEQAAKDLERLQGTWHVLQAISKNGKEYEAAGSRHFVIKGDRITEWIEGFEAGLTGATFTLDPSRSPGWIDVTRNGRTFLGLYRFGDRGPEIILGTPGWDRPTAFAPADGNPGHGGKMTLKADKR